MTIRRLIELMRTVYEYFSSIKILREEISMLMHLCCTIFKVFSEHSEGTVLKYSRAENMHDYE